MSSLWSGATQYVRVPDSKKEIWVPKGFTGGDHLYCWKVKYDPQSSKHFFVNVAGFGKRWKLPDIYDPRVQEEMKSFAARIGITATSTTATSTTRSPSHSKHYHRHHHHSLASTTGDLHMTREGQRDSREKAKQQAMLGGYEDESPMMASPPPPPPEGDLSSFVKNVPVDLIFAYDNQEDWANIMPTVKKSGGASQPVMTSAKMQAAEAERVRQMEVERAAMEAGDSPLISPRRPGFDPDALRQLRHQQQALEVELEQTAHDQQARMASIERSAQIHEEQRLNMDSRYRHEMAEISQAEKSLSLRVAKEAEVVRARSEEKAKQRSPSPVVSSGLRLHTVDSAHTPIPRDSAMQLTVADDTSPLSGGGGGETLAVLALQQLEHERKTNERLRQELDEKEKLILEYKIADAEREQREMALRMKLLESMVASRRKEQLLIEAEGEGEMSRRRQIVESMNRSESRDRYIPPHPLMDH